MSKDLTLYELAEEAVALDELTFLEDGEWTPEIDQLHTELMEKLFAKVDSYGAYAKTLEARYKAAKAERERLAAREKAFENRLKWLKDYAGNALVQMGRNSIEGTIATIARQRNSTPSVITPALVDALPPKYIRVIPEVREPNKDAIAQALKAGQEIPGCALEYGYHVRIR